MRLLCLSFPIKGMPWDGISIIFILYDIQCCDTFSIYIYIYILYTCLCTFWKSLSLSHAWTTNWPEVKPELWQVVLASLFPTWKCCWLPQFNLIQTLLVGGQRDGVRPCLQCQGWVWSSETSFFRQKCYWKINQVRSFMAHFLGFKTPLIGIGCPGLSGNLNKCKQFNNMGSFQQLFLGSKILLLSFVTK